METARRPVLAVCATLLALALPAALTSCHDGGGGGSGGGTKAEVGAAGGTVGDPVDGPAAVVPPGALAATTTVTIQGAGNIASADHERVGAAFRFGPSGTTFSTPVTVRLPFDASRLPAGFTPADIVVLRRDDTTGAVDALTPLTVNVANETVDAETAHFSSFQAAVDVAGGGLPTGVWNTSSWNQAAFGQ